jgi:type I restriction enzyme R subunit
MTEFQAFTESGVEADFLKWLDDEGWEVYGKGNQWGSEILDKKYGREREEVIYWGILKEKLIKLNDEITEENVDRFASSLKRDLSHDNLLKSNKKFHKLLRKGKKFTFKTESGSKKTKAIQLIDFENLEDNRFIAANQFRVRQAKGSTKRPDVNLFVNGIPLVTVELKSITQENDYYNAIEDIHEYEDKVSRLFVPGLLNVAADTQEFRYGAVGAPTEYYNPWKPTEKENQIQNKEAIETLLTKETLLDILDNFVFYEENSGRDVKITPRHMQYYASNLILDRVESQKTDRGLIWHTQGSGKSYTMLYTAKNLLKRNIIDNPQVLVIVDREKLEEQMGKTLSNIDFDLYDIAKSGKHLQQLLEDGSSTLILTTIQKFQTVDNESQGNPNTVVLTDEAHRFMEKDLGNKLEAVLPDSQHYGFTGTPVREQERNTFDHYSPEGETYLHRYSIKEGIQDNLILPVVFTPRHQMEWEINEEEIDVEFEESFASLPFEEKKEILKQYVTPREIAELQPRVNKISENITQHFQAVDKNGFKGMVVTPSKKAAAMYGERLQQLIGEDEVEVFISAQGDDRDIIQKFKTSSEERDQIIEKFEKEDKNPKMIVVCDMLLTGFDAPILKTMYLDRNLKNHSLLQAIARTNRLKKGKNNGEIVDYQGVFQNIDKALDYSEEVQESAAIEKDKLFTGNDEIKGFKPLLEELVEIFEEVEKTNSSEALNQAVTILRKNPDQRKQFKDGMRRLEDLYESISPDKRLAENDIQQKYKWLTQVRIAFKSDEKGPKTNPEDQMREKTKEIIERNVDITKIKDNFSSYKLSKEHLEEIKGLEPSVKATKVTTSGTEHLRPRQNQNPRYKKLSERLNEVIAQWQGGEISDVDAVEKAEDIAEEALELDNAPEKKGMEDYEYAFYTKLIDEYGEYVEEDEAEEIASMLGEKFREKIDTTFSKWYKNEEVKKKFGQIIVEVLLKDFDKKELYIENRNTLVEDFWTYTIENQVDEK